MASSLTGKLVRISSVLAAFAVLASSRPLLAQGNMQRELAALAKDVKKFLDGRNAREIAVGAFTGPDSMPASSGPAISQILSTELHGLGIQVKPKARLKVLGKYKDVEDKKTEYLAVALSATIVDDRDKVLVNLDRRGIFGDESVSALMGLTVQLPPDGDNATRDKKLKESIDKPQAYLVMNRIGAAKESPYGVEILVKAGEQWVPRKPRLENGLPYVEIKRDEVYAVRVINDSLNEAAITLTIDGLNLFAFSDERDKKTGRPKYSQVVLAPKSKGTITGWHRSNTVSNEFLVTEYPKSAAAELQSTAKVGTITVSFAASWQKNTKPPADEPQDAYAYARSGNATGRGADVEKKFKEVERQFGVVRSAISVRYTK